MLPLGKKKKTFSFVQSNSLELGRRVKGKSSDIQGKYLTVYDSDFYPLFRKKALRAVKKKPTFPINPPLLSDLSILFFKLLLKLSIFSLFDFWKCFAEWSELKFFKKIQEILNEILKIF